MLIPFRSGNVSRACREPEEPLLLLTVYSSFQLAKKYIHYYLTAHNGKGHGMHSPFVFEMITRVLNDRSREPVYKELEGLRTSLLRDPTEIVVQDYGAGSRLGATKTRKISSIAKAALKPPKFAELLYRIVKYYQPETILELGTSLGITTSYLAKANPEAKIITIEGSDAIAGVARANFEKLGIGNIRQVKGNFDEVLPHALCELSPVGLAYVDGNHLYAPTINYFHQILEHTANDSILIFDDIHWSREMEQAWRHIQRHHTVTTTIDLFFIGIVLIRNEFKERQHFTIRF
jgi:predicted O-methyltransferase YrrM